MPRGSQSGASSIGSGRSSPTRPGRAVEARERDFWDEHVPSLARCLDEYRSGPDANTTTLLDALEPLEGRAVLDFACGAGVFSAWLADRGGAVTGVDLSVRSLERARELAEHTGSRAEFRAAGTGELRPGSFDTVAGRFALHHVDVRAVAPQLASALRPGGRAAFLETMATNPVLPFLRRHVAGRFGIPRYGTTDEHPLTAADLEAIAQAFGAPVELRLSELVFFRLFDRQVLGYRSRRASRVLDDVDDALHRLGRDRWSYHQVVTVAKPA
jgi:SAM-dependent methyltransferase